MNYNNDSQKKCGFCGETIPAGASRCPYCGSLLEVTFDNGYGSSQPNQPADTGMNPFSGGPAGFDNGQVSGNESTPVNNEASNPAQSSETPWGQGQTQPQEPASAQAQSQEPSQYQAQPQSPAPAQYQPQQGGQGQWQNPERPMQDYQRPYYQNRPQQGPRYDRPALSNGLKVFLTVLFTLLPGIGQLAGIITAIVFMSSEGDSDRRSFGVALLVACIIMFVLACIGCFIISIASASLPFGNGNF